MANVSRYVNMDRKVRIRGNRRTLRQWLLRKFFRPEVPEIFSVVNMEQPYYPAGYKK